MGIIHPARTDGHNDETGLGVGQKPGVQVECGLQKKLFFKQKII
jgi:hypothetical protein